MDRLGERKAGYRKIRFCGEQANRDGIQYFWVDSCCIDKSSSAELAEGHQLHVSAGIEMQSNAMSICPTFRPLVSIQEYSAKAGGFTRGWTLQELLAPRSVEFFSKEGQRLGDKQSLELQIHQITNIPVQALQQPDGLFLFKVEERMSMGGKA